jgi:hypothetical protein
VLNGRRVSVRLVSFPGERQRGEQLVRVDGIRKRLEQLERSELPLQQPQPLPIRGEHTQRSRPAFRDLAEQFQPGPILQALARNDDIELVLPQQVDAVGLIGNGVDYEVLAQGAHSRFQHR